MIIVVCGPTAVGKTKMSETLREKFDGIIINADSRQIYKELNIGTAKPKKEELSNKHYLFNMIKPDEEYNAYNYQTDVRKIIEENKEKNIIIVGGTGLYIKAALYDYDFKSDNKDKLLYDAIFIGLKTDRETLYEKINSRVDEMIKDGLVEEARGLYKKYGDVKVLTNTIGYQEFAEYFKGNKGLDDAIDLIKKNSRHYAKRQFTWFNNQMNIKWFDVDYENFNNTINEVLKYIKKGY